MSAKRDQIVRRAKPALEFDHYPFSQEVRANFAALSEREPWKYPSSPRSARNRKGVRAS